MEIRALHAPGHRRVRVAPLGDPPPKLAPTSHIPLQTNSRTCLSKRWRVAGASNRGLTQKNGVPRDTMGCPSIGVAS
eukprot:11196820-Lingulodinium_polyedra.AAC.1